MQGLACGPAGKPDGNHVSTSATLGEQLLTIAEIAEALQVNHRTIRTLINDGQIRAVRVGVQIRVEPSALREYLERNTMRGDQ